MRRPPSRPRPDRAPSGARGSARASGDPIDRVRVDQVSLARALSKLGAGSRRDGERWTTEGRVRVNGHVVRDPSARIDPGRDRITLDGDVVRPAERVYLAMHKPRGVVTSRAAERGAPTVYDLLPPECATFVSPVGRLDKASAGLLLFTNDTRWAGRLLDPAAHVAKVYHVHVDTVPTDALLAALKAGVATPEGEVLAARRARVLRATGTRTGWLELVLDEGKNRHIRRMLAAVDVDVLRLIRVAVGPLSLGDLARGAVRALTPAERAALGAARSVRQSVG